MVGEVGDSAVSFFSALKSILFCLVQLSCLAMPHPYGGPGGSGGPGRSCGTCGSCGTGRSCGFVNKVKYSKAAWDNLNPFVFLSCFDFDFFLF